MSAKDVAYMLRRLQLGPIAPTLPTLYAQAAAESWSYEQFLHTVLDGAVATRETRSVERRIREAGFPSTTKTLESYDFTAQPALRKTVVLQLATLDFIRRKEGVILLGPTEPMT